MRKIISLYKRRASVGVEAFQLAWRDDHGARLRALPHLIRCVQSHALLQGYAKGELLFDGIEEMWFADDASAAAALTSPQWGAIVAAAQDLIDPARTVVMPVDVLVIKDGHIPAGAVKNIEFVNQRPRMSLLEFRRYWQEHHGPLASRIPPLRRYEQNHTSLSAYLAGPRPDFDGFAITWFASTADMKLGTKTPEYVETRADEPVFLPDGHLPIIITREHVVCC